MVVLSFDDEGTRQRLLEESKGSFHGSLGLSTSRRRVQLLAAGHRLFDHGGVVARSVVQGHGHGHLSLDGVQGIVEGVDDRAGVLSVGDQGPDGGVRCAIDEGLEVEVERLSAQHDGDLLAVAEPLHAREVQAHRATTPGSLG